MMLDNKVSGYELNYSDIFELRGQMYHLAMQRYPEARASEFLSVIREAGISPGMTVLDIPSGGGYLSRYLGDMKYIGLETSKMFAVLAAEQAENVVLHRDACFPLKNACADRVLSIAGLHHVRDKRRVFSEMRRVIRPEGHVIVADVAEDSFVRAFLDDFVGSYCETGHSGWYFGPVTRQELGDAGLRIISDKCLDYAWYANDIEQLAEFCKLLFGMVAADTGTVIDGIREYLGIFESGHRMAMNWQLRCYTCEALNISTRSQ